MHFFIIALSENLCQFNLIKIIRLLGNLGQFNLIKIITLLGNLGHFNLIKIITLLWNLGPFTANIITLKVIYVNISQIKLHLQSSEKCHVY